MYSILHIETNPLYQKLIADICADTGVQYWNAPDADTAASLLEREPVSLIITALHGEDGSTADFIKAVNETDFSYIPIVVFTQTDTLEARKAMFELGIVDYLLADKGGESIRQCILAMRRQEPVDLRMPELSYAVLDDSKLDKMVIAEIFAMYRIPQVSYFDNADLLLALDQNFDVYLVELALREATDIIARIKRRHPASVVIAISSIDNAKTIARVLSSGADDYLAKPFNHPLFHARLKTNIRSYLLLQDAAKKAVTDSLTGLFNRGYIFQRLAQEAERLLRYGSPFSILLLDIDHFKNVNDTYGHLFGDLVLSKVASAISSAIRAVDIAGRYGGEEFIVILPEISIMDACLIAERIRAKVAALTFSEHPLLITISSGVATASGDEAVRELLNRADALLYQAKKEGRNRVCF